jgi:hypothetical protein
MSVDYAAEGALVVTVGLTVLVAILALLLKWHTFQKETRARYIKLFKATPILTVGGSIYFGLFDHTSHGTGCQRSTSPDGRYTAERCMVDWDRDSPEYVGRLFDASTGRKLAQHTFNTPVPQLSWSPGFQYQPKPEEPFVDVGPFVSFSVGGDDDSSINLPPSKWDRLLAMRPHIFGVGPDETDDTSM